MWNGFDTSCGTLLHGRRHIAEAAVLAFTFALATALTGCAHSGESSTPTLATDLATLSAKDLFDEGVAYALRGDTLRAEHYLGLALRSGHDVDEVVCWLVRVCVASSRYRTALKHAETHLRDHPDDWWLRLVTASIHDALGDPGSALGDLEWVAAQRPQDPFVHYRLGLLYRERLDDHVSCRHHFEHYLRLAPAGPHSAEVRAELEAGLMMLTGPQRLPRRSSSGKPAR